MNDQPVEGMIELPREKYAEMIRREVQQDEKIAAYRRYLLLAYGREVEWDRSNEAIAISEAACDRMKKLEADNEELRLRLKGWGNFWRAYVKAHADACKYATEQDMFAAAPEGTR